MALPNECFTKQTDFGVIFWGNESLNFMVPVCSTTVLFDSVMDISKHTFFKQVLGPNAFFCLSCKNSTFSIDRDHITTADILLGV